MYRHLLFILLLPLLLLSPACKTKEEKIRDYILNLKSYSYEQLKIACKAEGIDVRQFNKPPVFAWPCCLDEFSLNVLYCSKEYDFLYSAWQDGKSLIRINPKSQCDIKAYGSYQDEPFTDIDQAVKRYGQFSNIF